MKKKLLYVFALFIVLVFAGCQNDVDVSTADTPKATEAPEATETPGVTEAPEITEAPEVTEVPKATEPAASVFEYQITDERTIAITGLLDSEIELISVPRMIEECPVTSIGSYAFVDCSSLTSIVVSSGSYAEGWATWAGYEDILVLK